MNENEVENLDVEEFVTDNTSSNNDTSKENLGKGLNGVKGVFSKVSDKSKKIAEKVNEEEVKQKEDALVTCRYLFYSVLDKIFIVLLLIVFFVSTYSIFKGSISSLNYGFWGRVGREIVYIIIFFIIYLLINWLYKCLVKSMLCVTKTQIYSEKYIPFHRWETTIPLNKVTAINSYKFLWIFRAVVIHQYGKLPSIFWTWNAQEFKDKVEELLNNTNVKVNNQFETKNIISKNQYKYVAILGALLVVILSIVGVVRFFNYMLSDERHMDGVYTYEKSSITLNSDGTCKLDVTSLSNVSDCTWEYDSDTRTVNMSYKYKYFGYSYNSSISAEYEDKALTYNGKEYKK